MARWLPAWLQVQRGSEENKADSGRAENHMLHTDAHPDTHVHSLYTRQSAVANFCVPSQDTCSVAIQISVLGSLPTPMVECPALGPVQRLTGLAVTLFSQFLHHERRSQWPDGEPCSVVSVAPVREGLGGNLGGVVLHSLCAEGKLQKGLWIRQTFLTIASSHQPPRIEWDRLGPGVQLSWQNAGLACTRPWISSLINCISWHRPLMPVLSIKCGHWRIKNSRLFQAKQGVESSLDYVRPCVEKEDRQVAQQVRCLL